MNKYLNRFVVGDTQVEIGSWQYRSGGRGLASWYGQEAVWIQEHFLLLVILYREVRVENLGLGEITWAEKCHSFKVIESQKREPKCRRLWSTWEESREMPPVWTSNSRSLMLRCQVDETRWHFTVFYFIFISSRKKWQLRLLSIWGNRVTREMILFWNTIANETSLVYITFLLRSHPLNHDLSLFLHAQWHYFHSRH